MKSIVIFGTGFTMHKFIYSNMIDNKRISFFLDNNPTADLLFGKKVQKPSDVQISVLKTQTIVVCSTDYYDQIACQLNRLGLEEFKNYIPYTIYNKKMVLLVGNCHMDIISSMLMRNPDFNKNYGLYRTDLTNAIKGEEDDVRFDLTRWDGILAFSDVILHQDIKPDNAKGQYFSSEYIGRRCKSGCINITMINVFGCGRIYFPWAKKINMYNMKFNTQKYGIFPSGDAILDRLIASGKSYCEIYDIVTSDALYDEEELRIEIENIFEKYRMREVECDIRVIDYIETNYRKKKLFYDEKHPSNAILLEVVKRFFEILNISYEIMDNIVDVETEFPSFTQHSLPIYPSIKKALKLEFNDEPFRKGKDVKLTENAMFLSDYIQQYIYCCKDNILENEDK